MKLYFDFYNDAGQTKYIYLNNINNKLNINLDKFNMTAHIDEELDLNYKKITDYFLVIEKEVNGTYILEKKINGSYNSGTISYENCNFDDIVSNSSSYKLYFQFHEGGVIVYNGKDKPFLINLKTKCEDFDVDIYDSIMIDEYYEIQKIDTELSSITFKMSIINNKNFNNYKYFYVFSSAMEENFEHEYKILTENEIEIIEPISIASFSKGVTYLHFYLKDTFDNISHRIFKITTKQNTLTLFEIINKEINLVKDEIFSIFYKSRNIKSVTPVIETVSESEEKKIYVSKKNIGTLDLNKNVLTFKLSDYFEEDFSNNKLFLYFQLNENKNDVSNKMLLLIDSVPPEISITNFQDNYKLITNDESFVEIVGQIKDENFFYLGNNKQKMDLKKAKHYLIVYSEYNIYSVLFDGVNEKKEFLKYSNFYVVESLSETFTIYDKDDSVVPVDNYTYINDFTKNGFKNLYIFLDESELSQYEINIIEHQNGLKIKGDIIPFISKQEFSKFTSIYYIKCEINNDINNTCLFDVGVEDFGYSFLPKINYSNISCNLTNKKEAILNFNLTNLIIIKSNQDIEVTKFKSNKIVQNLKTTTFEELSFLPISLSNDEFFSLDGEFMYWDDTLNSYPYEEIYSQPILKDKENVVLNYRNYSVTELDKDLYTFNFITSIEDGINEFKLEYSDIVDNKKIVEFTVEKNTKKINVVIDELFNKNFNKFQSSENSYELSTNRSSINIKFIIENETLDKIKKDTYLIIKNDTVYKKQKILNESGKRVVYIEFQNQNIKQENNQFFVYYDNEVKENISFKLKNIQTLTLNTISKFISGFNQYYLKYEIDEFAKIKVTSSNKNIICSIQPENKIIKIVRINSNDFLEKSDISILVTDQHNLYTPIKQTVSAIFYNDNIINTYHIDDMVNYYIINQQFNLKISSLYTDKIEYIKFYDKLEADIFKRNKFAIFDSDDSSTFIIKNIVTPIIPSSLEISIKVKDEDLIINKRLFEDDKISLYEEKNNFVINYIKDNRFNVRIFNKEKNHLFIKKIEIYNNDKLLDTIENVEFNNKEYNKEYYYNLDNFDGEAKITTKIYNKFEKLIFINSELVNFDPVSVECWLKDFKEYNVLKQSDLNNIVLESNLTDGEYWLTIKEITGMKKTIKLKLGNNSFTCDNGQYLFEVYYKKYNYLKKTAVYNVELINDNEDYIDYTKEYSRFLNINQIFVHKNINTPFKYLNPVLLHFHNKQLIKTYHPDFFVNNKICFSINKYIGNNLYIYKDVKIEKRFEEYNKEVFDNNQQFEIFSLHTDEKALFYDNKKSMIILDKLENIKFKTIGVDKMIIETSRVTSKIERYLIDNVENVLFKEFIPCKVSFYNHNNFIKEIKFEIPDDEFDKIEFPHFSSPFKSNDNKTYIYPIRIKNSSNDIKVVNFSIKHKLKHFLYNYVKDIAILSDVHNLNIDKFIEKYTIEYYDIFKNNDIQELKKYLKEKILEEKWRK